MSYERSPDLKPVTSIVDHEENSQARYECLSEQIKDLEKKGKEMGMDNINDKVNINVAPGGGSGGGFDMGGLAAMMMASRGDDSQSNIWASILPALMNQRDAGVGGNGLWPLLLLFLLRGRGGLGDGGGDCGLVDPAILQGVNALQAAVPTNALQTQNALLEMQNALTSQISQGNIALNASITNTKDAVQNSAALLLQNAGQNTQSILQAIGSLSTKIDTNTIADLQRQLGVAQAREAEERHFARTKEVETNVTNNITQVQAQQQQQQQFQELLRQFGLFGANLNILNNQVAKSSQDVINVGGLLSGVAQTANPVNVK